MSSILKISWQFGYGSTFDLPFQVALFIRRIIFQTNWHSIHNGKSPLNSGDEKLYYFMKKSIYIITR